MNNGTLSLNIDGGFIQIPNNISGSGSLQVIGGGAATLTGNNSYSGQTILAGSGAYLIIGDGATAGTLGSGPVTGAGALQFERSDSITVPNAIGDSSSNILLYQAGTGTMTLTGAIDPGTALYAEGGALSISEPSAAVNLLTVTGTFIVPSGMSLTANSVNVSSGNLTVAAGGSLSTPSAVSVSSTGTLTVNGTTQNVSVLASSVPSPALAGCLLRGTGTVGAVLADDLTNLNAVVWPGLADTVGALTANEQLTVDSLDFTSGGKIAVVVKNSGGFSQKLVVMGDATFPTFDSVFSFATDTTSGSAHKLHGSGVHIRLNQRNDFHN